MAIPSLTPSTGASKTAEGGSYTHSSRDNSAYKNRIMRVMIDARLSCQSPLPTHRNTVGGPSALLQGRANFQSPPPSPRSHALTAAMAFRNRIVPSTTSTK